jgi:hypothetical protein
MKVTGNQEPRLNAQPATIGVTAENGSPYQIFALDLQFGGARAEIVDRGNILGRIE